MINVETLHARMNAEGRVKMTWPTLLRSASQLIMVRPVRGSQRYFAQFMEEKLPEFQYNARYGWWEAPLTAHNYQRAATVCRVRIGPDLWRETLHISDGVQTWLDEIVGEEREAEDAK